MRPHEYTLHVYREARMKGRPLSIAALAEEVGLARKTVREHLTKCVVLGLATQKEVTPRGQRGRPFSPITLTRMLLLKTVSEHWDEHGRAPTYLWLAEELEVSLSTVKGHVQVCQEFEWLSAEKGAHATLSLLPAGVMVLDQWLGGAVEAAA